MRIIVKQILDRESGQVTFDCPAGHAWGYWKGRIPAAPGDYDVEFDIPDDVRGVDTAYSAGDMKSAITEDGEDAVRLAGTVEAVGDDGVVTLRIGAELILLEPSESDPQIQEGRTISFTVARIDLYPYQL